MLFTIGLLLIVFFLGSLILPWTFLGRFKRLEQDIKRLTRLYEQGLPHPQPEEKREAPSPLSKTSPPEKSILDEAREKLPFFKDMTTPSVPPQKKAPPPEKQQSFEQKYVVSLPVWIGAVALALSGAFLVKYSIEMGFLSPGVRIILGLLFGFCLLFLGYWIHQKHEMANGVRISQALSGAGIADLYVCLFAATSYYHLVPSSLGFLGMACVTAMAVILSLTQGAPIAMLGMVGGLLTPALIQSDAPNAQMLFLYLYVVLAGLFTVIRMKEWWFISIPVVLGTFMWVILWMSTSYVPSDSLWIGLFLMAVSGTIVFQSKKAMEKEDPEKLRALSLFPFLNYLSLGGSVILMSVVAAKAHFGAMEWELFWLLAAGGLLLSYFNQKLYGFVPWISLGMTALMLVGWHEPDPRFLASVLVAFALLYSLGGVWLMGRSSRPFPWALLSAGSSFLYYILAYGKFHQWFDKKVVFPQDPVMDTHFWGGLAFVLFVASVLVLLRILNRAQGDEQLKQRLLTVFTLTATAFLSISLAIEVDKQFFTIALSAEILAISWVNGYVQIKSLRFLAAGLAVLFGILIVPQLLTQIMALPSKTTLSQPHVSFLFFSFPYVPSIPWSLLHLGLPALLFGASSLLLRKEKDDSVTRAFEGATVLLWTILTYYLSRLGFHINEDLLKEPSTFIERGVLTNIFLLYAFVCLWLGQRFNREALTVSGLCLIGLAFLRIFFFDLLTYNPLWSHQYMGNLPLLNGLLLPYAFPIVWILMMQRYFSSALKESYWFYKDIELLVLLFCFVTLTVRQLYHGAYLDEGITSNGEIYTYSAAWLMTGLALLFYGTLKQNKMLRIASLAFMMLTISKVFLYDAAELTGLLRVFSFLGLGISLLGLSWFYARFVFMQRKE